jgi:hypothetical protein
MKVYLFFVRQSSKLYWLSFLGCPFRAALSGLLCPGSPVPAVLSQLSCLQLAVMSCPGIFVLSWLSCHGYTVLSCTSCFISAVLFRLSCSGCPVLTVLLRLFCLSNIVFNSVVLPVLFCLSCPGLPVKMVKFRNQC